MGRYTPELSALMEHEKGIEQNLSSAAEFAWHMNEIRRLGLFRAADFKTFDDYMEGRWSKKITRQEGIAARRQLVAAERAEGLSQRAIAEKLDIPRQTVHDDLQVSESGHLPERVTGLDGKSHPASRVSKSKLSTGVSHPARFSKELLPMFAELLDGCRFVIDPFGGTGQRLAELGELMPHTKLLGIEIEPEWANVTPEYMEVGNALDLAEIEQEYGTPDGIVTSPTYGNRLADSHEAKDASVRRSYTHDLGRKLSESNSGDLQWGKAYKDFHEQAWKEAVRILAPGGVFVLNMKDHIRNGLWMDVTTWHVNCLLDLGLRLDAIRPVRTADLRQGENADARVDAEMVVALVKQ